MIVNDVIVLSGKKHSRCSLCGGPMQVAHSKKGTKLIKVYVCAWHRDRGHAVCTNAARRPVELPEALVAEIDKRASRVRPLPRPADLPPGRRWNEV